MQKTKTQFKLRSSLLYVLGVFVWVMVAVVWITNPGFAASIAQSYQTKTTLQQGLIVQLVPNDSNEVETVPNTSMSKTLGVIINPSSTDIAISNNSPGQHVFVSNSGDYPVIVSDQNGYIKSGDYITVSEINGVGMAADSSETTVIGEATSQFNDQTKVIGTETIKGLGGSTQTVQLGLIYVNIAIAHNPLEKPAYSFVPAFLLSISKSITGKAVSTWKIYLSIAILFLVLIITLSMLNGAVKSSLISVGRNPLSAKVITRGFLDIAFMALIILVSGIFGVYLLLKL